MTMKKIHVIVLAALLLSPLAAQADANDKVEVNGEVNLGVSAVKKSTDSAKFQEYRDMSDGGFGSVQLNLYQEDSYLNLDSENMGSSDQSYRLNSGDYQNYDFSVFYNQTPHNLTFGARTPMTGIGGNDLRVAPASTPTNTSLWNSFDYTVTRKQYGAEFTVDLDSPYYLTLGVQKEERRGLKPLSSGGFGGMVEMPEPVNYATNDFTVEGGYRNKDLMVSASGYFSQFSNANKYLQWENPASSNAVDINAMPPENDFSKFSANATLKKLPMTSVLAVRASYAKATNDVSYSELGLTTTLVDPTLLNRTTFEGEVKYTTASISLASQPISKLDTELYYRYLNHDNNSSRIIYNGTSAEIFGYKENTMGLEAGYRLPMQTKAQAGFEYLKVDRSERPDAESTTDNRFFVQLRNHSLDFLGAKLKYQRTERTGDRGVIAPGTTAADNKYVTKFVYRFDAADKDEDKVELGLDFYLADNLDLALEYRFKKNKYPETVLGRTADERNEIYADATLRLPKDLVLSAFIGYETITSDSTLYNFSNTALADPVVDDGNPATYRWTQGTDDKYWSFGLSAAASIIPGKLRATASYRYDKSDGEVNLTSEGATALLDIGASDDYTRKHFDTRLIYAYAKDVDITLGYIYENLKYSDLQVDNYDYSVGSNYLSGANANSSYEANVGYLMMSYRF